MMCTRTIWCPSQALALRRSQRPTGRRSVSAPAKADLDPIERAVQWLFGQKSLEDRKPFGLSRMEGALLEQQYEANVTDRAQPLEGDCADAARVRSMLAHTMLEHQRLRVAYSAEEHGWSATAFHNRVDRQGPAVMIATSSSGATFGALNPVGWEGLGDQLDSRAAFLFTWPDGNTDDQGIKLQKVGGPGLAIIDSPDHGPKFGADGLFIPLERSTPRAAQCRLGTFYQRLPDGSRSLCPEGGTTQLVDLKVLVATDSQPD